MRQVGIALVLAAISAALPRVSSAQSETKSAVADALYRQARDLMAAGKLDEACPKFAESQRLDPATGTLLNLAACHERQGKLASAWLEYSDAVVAARLDRRQDRVDFATERAAALEPKLSRLTLTLAPDADPTSLTLELDGASFGLAAIGAPTPVDPGKHTVRASAPGKQPWQKDITIGAEADLQTLAIPKLEDAPIAPVAAAPLTAAAAPTAPPPQPRDELGHRPVPQSVYISGGVTLALAVGAGVTSVVYLNKRDSYQDARQSYLEGSGSFSASDLEDMEQSAKTWGYTNVALWAATACGAGLTTYFYLSRPTRAASARVMPWLGPGLAGLGVSGEL
jgi:hypothetical protein